jgi:ankyrin repeat protein
LRASGGGHAEIVRKLLQVGADSSLSARTGATPLSAAISMRHAPVVEQLLRAGASPTRRCPAASPPLMLAAALGLPGHRRPPAARRAPNVAAVDEPA